MTIKKVIKEYYATDDGSLYATCDAAKEYEYLQKFQLFIEKLKWGRYLRPRYEIDSLTKMDIDDIWYYRRDIVRFMIKNHYVNIDEFILEE